MKAITILNRCRGAEEEIRRLREKARQRREAASSLAAPQADPNGGSRGGNPIKDKIGEILADADVLERKADERNEAWQVESVASMALLDMIPDLESQVLYLYYVQKESTTSIARKKKYQTGYVRKVKRRAEQLLDMLSEPRVDSTLPPWYLAREKERR